MLDNRLARGARAGRSRVWQSAYARSLVVGQPRQVTPEPGADPAQLARLLAAAKPHEILLVDPLDDWLTTSESDGRADRGAGRVRRHGDSGRLRGEPGGARVAGGAGAGRTARRGEPGPRRRPPTRWCWSSLGSRRGSRGRRRLAAADGGDRRAGGDRTGSVQPARTAHPGRSDQRRRPPSTRGLGGLGLGALERVVAFAAGTQGETTPAPWRQPRVLVLGGDHGGAAAAGAARPRPIWSPGCAPAPAHWHCSPGRPVRGVRVVETAAAAAIEAGPAMDDAAVEEAMAHGWRLAEQAADEGVDLLIVAGLGAGAETAAAAVAAVHTNTEPAMLLGWVRTADGNDRRSGVDPPLRRGAGRGSPGTRRQPHRRPGSAGRARRPGHRHRPPACCWAPPARRTPVLLDGPVAAAAALVARNLAGQARHWWLLPDHGDHPTVRRAAGGAAPGARCSTCGWPWARGRPPARRCRCCAGRSVWPRRYERRLDHPHRGAGGPRMSTSHCLPPGLSRRRAAPGRSPSAGWARTCRWSPRPTGRSPTNTRICGRGMPRPAPRGPTTGGRPRRPLGQQRIPPPELRLGPADRPTDPGLHRA